MCPNGFYTFSVKKHEKVIKVKSIIKRDFFNQNRMISLERFNQSGKPIREIVFSAEGRITNELEYKYNSGFSQAKEFIYDESMILQFHEFMKFHKDIKVGNDSFDKDFFARPFVRVLKHYHKNDTSFVDSYVGTYLYAHEETDDFNYFLRSIDTTKTSNGDRVSIVLPQTEVVKYFNYKDQLIKEELYTINDNQKILDLRSIFYYDSKQRLISTKGCYGPSETDCVYSRYSFKNLGDTLVQTLQIDSMNVEKNFFIKNVLVRKEIIENDDNGNEAKSISIYNLNGLLVKRKKYIGDKKVSHFSFYYTYW